MRPIKLVDLYNQNLRIKKELDQAIQAVFLSTDFIQGDEVKKFESALSGFMEGTQVISCGNGTDALQIAMMALDIKPGDEVIVPVFTYVATAEVIALLRLVPVFADVDPNSFMLDMSCVEGLITKKTAAIVPVHLFGQCADMAPLLDVAARHKLHVIEDTAQALGARYKFPNGKSAMAGTMGSINTTSFFPTKNLGAFGDGGAIFTGNPTWAERLKMIANHGQKKKYYHDLIGVNSRLDTIQAAVLNVKLGHLKSYEEMRRQVANFYDVHLKNIPFIKIPRRMENSTHVFHQYTVITEGIDRDALKVFLQQRGIPTTVFYPLPLHLQQAYRKAGFGPGSFPVAEKLSETVLSLPIHTEMDEEQLSYICDSIRNFK